MIRQQKIAKNLARNLLLRAPFRLLKNLPDREKIPERLGHLLLIDLHESVMNPVAREFFPRRATGLRNFVLMVRENEIHAPAVDVKSLTEVSNGHGRTFNMPARAASLP